MNTSKDPVQSNADADGFLPISKKDSVKANIPTEQPNPSVTTKSSMQAIDSSGTITTDPLPQHTNKFQVLKDDSNGTLTVQPPKASHEQHF